MNAQCSKEHVARLPDATRAELQTKEDVENRQLLLNEEWHIYAAKCGLQHSDLRVKNTTESWDAFEDRKKKQQTFFELQERLAEKEKASNEATERARRVRSDAVIEKLMAFDRERQSRQTPAQHTLFVDFWKLQLQVFSQQRQTLEGCESLIRAKLCEGESELLYGIVNMWHAETQLQQTHLLELAREKQAMEHQLELIEQQKIEEEKQREAERIAREKQLAEEEKERIEAEKRLERRRREEERRTKARLEREQRMSRDGPSEN